MIKLIVGLANPGSEYTNTRHNAGAWFIEQLANQAHTNLKPEKKFHGLVAEINLYDNNCRLLIPSTYMNLSGNAVASLANFYKIEPKEMLVVHDELDLAPGIAKLKFAGGHAGHNGLRDIFEKLGSRDFYRLRIGIGKPAHSKQTSDYVLGRPSKTERELIDNSISKAIDVLPELLANKFEQAMHKLHSEEK